MSKKKSILLVDDEEGVLLTLSMIFMGEGYDVTPADSGAQALKILSERSFDAVVTDLNMEKEDIGLEVARAAVLKSPRPTVIVCTGYASISNSKACMNIGVDYMAHKPVELKELISALDRLLRLRDHRNSGGTTS
ncbi:MAG: response regulator [Acidobacteriota bacterium]|nr:response regulator [Acidobacteriota bacterium]